jgi:predicted DNA-binding transcriptional regulator AlpA
MKPYPTQRTDGIARKAERRALTGVPDSSWDRLEAQGLAPKRVHLSARCVGWFRDELAQWVEQRRAERNAGAAPFTASQIVAVFNSCETPEDMLAVRQRRMNWDNCPNLALRPPAPAKERGRVQRCARRALIARGVASTSEIIEWTHGRKRHPHSARATRRALEQIGAVRVGRADSIGRPWLWRLKETTSESER